MTLLSTALTTVWTVLIPLAEEVPDPEDVKQGWIGFVVFMGLLAAVVFLALSFRKQLRKVNFEETPDATQDPAQDPTQDQAPAGPADGRSGPAR